jgi:hypothetical protein
MRCVGLDKTLCLLLLAFVGESLIIVNTLHRLTHIGLAPITIPPQRTRLFVGEIVANIFVGLANRYALVLFLVGVRSGSPEVVALTGYNGTVRSWLGLRLYHLSFASGASRCLLLS